ncbi:beta-lactamase family protein [Pendulispora brunnea]|uniref:Beta-lactamase family protein n=1 Tax=Pendulispora brunnea TaxID=2905690 RepID=A0ABZ2JWD3_9BACT
MGIRHLLLSWLVIGASLGCAARTAPPRVAGKKVDPLAAKVDSVFARFTPATPGCAVGIYRAGQVVFSRGYGMADLEHGVPIRPNTVFDIASVSKQFTATAIVLLVQDGKLSLDDGIRKFLPELPEYTAPITVRHLLQHTSGLRDYPDLLLLEGFDIQDVTTDYDALWAIIHQRALNFAPGTAWAYSNSGYFLASLIVKRVSGETLAAFSKRRIFDPLGMTHTHFHDDPAALVPNRALGYTPLEADKYGVVWSGFSQTGDGAVMTTVEDLARWDANFYEPKLGGPKLLEALRTSGKLTNGRPTSYGMGLQFDSVRGIAHESHSGGWVGYKAHLERLPSERWSVAVLCNGDNVPASELAEGVFAAIDPRFRSDEPEGTTASAPPLEPFTGEYVDPVSLDARRFSVENGALVFRRGWSGGNAQTLVPLGPRMFRAKGGIARYEFVGDASGKPARVQRFVDGEEPTTYERTAARFTPNAKELEIYAGRYTSDEMRHDASVQIIGDNLYFGPWGRRPTIRLTPVRPDGFHAGATGFFFERDRAGKVIGLRLWDERSRNIRFKWKSRE